MDLYDYSPDAAGMTYHNDLDPSGVTVDGSPDAVSPGGIQWEMVTGSQGSVTVAHSVETDIDPFTYTSYYSDDSTPGVTQCTGDAFEYATSGLRINQTIPNTHPEGVYNILESTRVVYYETPGQTVADAELRFDQATTLLDLVTAPLPEPACSDGFDNDGDGLIDWDGGADWNGGIPITDPDPQCVGKPWRDREAPHPRRSYPCGLGVELALLLPCLIWLGSRTRRERRSIGRSP
jgi:hypothetical protein